MNDTLAFFRKDPIHRKYHHNQITFGLLYAFTENFVLVLSHDEVVYGKRSLLEKMPGDVWQKFANLRVLFAYMFGHPGKKLVFILTQGDPDEKNFSDIFPMYQGFAEWLGFSDIVLIRGCGLEGPDDASAREDIMGLAQETARKTMA